MPFPLIATGLAIVVLDFRMGAVDIAFDPLGWLLVAYGAWKLSHAVAASASVVAGVLSTSDALLPFHYVYVDWETGEVVDPRYGHPSEQVVIFDHVSGSRLAVIALSMVAAGVALWLLLDGLARAARTAGSPRAAGQLRLLHWGVLRPLGAALPGGDRPRGRHGRFLRPGVERGAGDPGHRRDGALRVAGVAAPDHERRGLDDPSRVGAAVPLVRDPPSPRHGTDTGHPPVTTTSRRRPSQPRIVLSNARPCPSSSVDRAVAS
jgi:hypothetical protein